ncbi:MAG: hypothetical protein R2794_01845 [Chitinophagales bacterium]
MINLFISVLLSVATMLPGGPNDAKLVIENPGMLPHTVYVRVALPDDTENHNNGFVQTIQPGKKIIYHYPEGTVVFACDGKYWDDYHPKEKNIVTLQGGVIYKYVVADFKVR